MKRIYQAVRSIFMLKEIAQARKLGIELTNAEWQRRLKGVEDENLPLLREQRAKLNDPLLIAAYNRGCEACRKHYFSQRSC